MPICWRAGRAPICLNTSESLSIYTPVLADIDSHRHASGDLKLETGRGIPGGCNQYLCIIIDPSGSPCNQTCDRRTAKARRLPEPWKAHRTESQQKDYRRRRRKRADIVVGVPNAATCPIGWQPASIQSAARLHMQLIMHAERSSEEGEGGDIFRLLFRRSTLGTRGGRTSFQPLGLEAGPFPALCRSDIEAHGSCAREQSLGTR